MNRTKCKLIAVVFTLAAIAFGGNTLQAQRAITFAGGDARNNTGSIAYSCGEVAVKTSIKKAVTVVNITEQYTEGVQQPYTDRDKDQYNSISPLTVKMDVYPNPTTEGVTIEGDNTETLHYTLYTANGQELQHGDYNGGQKKLDLTSYASGNYMLRIATKDNTKVNTYKIILLR